MACPCGLMRLAGTLLLGKGACVVGSKIGTCTPVVVTVCEKSPARSSAEGMV